MSVNRNVTIPDGGRPAVRFFVDMGDHSAFETNGQRGVLRFPPGRTDAATFAAVADEPLAELPDEITLTRDEAAIVLFGLDVVEHAGVGPEDAAMVTRAVHLLTAKLWPDLGGLLGGDDEA